MLKIKSILIIFAFTILSIFELNAKTPPPAWTVNPSNYTYNMTVTGIVNLNYAESTDAGDMVGAFINGECRGVENLVYDAGSGRYIAYLMVYSNSTSGTITFKVYDASTDSEITIPETMNFAVNGIVGSTEAPYVWSNPTLSNEAEILTYGFTGQVGGTTYDGNNISVVMPHGTDLTNLVANYTTSDYATVLVNDVEQTSGVTANNFTNSVEYLVESADETTEQTYNVSVSLANAVPTDIYLTSTSIDETSQTGATVGEISTEDANADDTHTYSFISGTGDTDNGSFNISGNLLKINNELDYETKTSYSIRLQVDDNNGGLFEKQFTITVVDENDETPTFAADEITIPENEPLQAIYTIVATDDDITPAFKVLNYSITGGNEDSKFSIHPTDGVISLISALDYEGTHLYELEISVTDGTNTGINIITINVSDINDETPVVTNSEEQVLETKLVGEQIGQVVATDADENSTLSYSITSGNTGSAYAINSSNGKITVASALDFETTEDYTLEISVNDGVNVGTGTFTINIVDVNDETPVVSDADVTISENTVVGTAVHTIVATDADANTTLTYSIVSGNTDNIFGINANTGVLRVLSDLDFETIETFHITVAAFDGDNSSTGVITISLTDENDENPVVQNETINVSETESAGTELTTVQATDADANTTFTYYITTGNGDGKFAINENSGVITLVGDLNYETNDEYILGIRVSDGLNNGTGTITINVQAINDQFPVVESHIVNLQETAIFGQIIHTVEASDPDGGSVLEYSITDGNTNSAFEINPDHGIVTVLGNIDYETIPTYTLTITVDDGLHQSTGTLTINLTNENDETPVVTETETSIDETSTVGSQVTTVSATDADGVTSFTYSIISGNLNNAFSINENTGIITVASELDYETNNVFQLEVGVNDGINIGNGTITINLNDINDEVPIINDASVSIAETLAINEEVLAVDAQDPDLGTTLEYSITNGNDEIKFDIDSETGIITLIDALDYETTTEYILTVKVFDGIDDASAEITISIIDKNDEEPTMQDAIVFVDEDAIFGEIVHNIVASDPDGNSVLEFSITGGNTNSAFKIDTDHGIVSVLGSLDYEITPTHSLTITVDDGLHQITGTLTVNINNLNDETPVVDEFVADIDETAGIGTNVTTAIATDPDGETDFIFSIIAGNSNNTFEIEPSTGIITVANDLDFENMTSYQLEIGANDGINIGNGTIVINVNDINDETPIINDGSVYISETLELYEQVFAVQAEDPDAGTTLEYSITNGNTEGKFEINSSTGIITLVDELDYETTTSYVLTVSVYDGAENVSADITISVIDKNDEVPVMLDGTVFVNEDENIGFALHTMEVTDDDAGSSFTFEITAGNDDNLFSVNEYLGVVMLTGSLDYETTTSYTLEVSVSDGLHTTTANVFVNVVDVDDNLPTVEDSEVYVDETEGIGTIICNVEASDADAISVLTYSIFSGNNDEIFLMNPTSGAITLAENLDYETKTDYVLQVNVTDGTNTASGIVTIHVNDMNDEIPVFADTTITVSEFAEINDFIAQLYATDADANSTFDFEISIDDDEGFFDLTLDGELSLIEYLDYEETPIHELTILVSDGVNQGQGVLNIKVIDEAEENFVAAELFTPNGDGENDFWVIENAHVYKNSQFYIYDNAGQLVYESLGYNNDWDGTFNGNPLPLGVYIYKVIFPDCENCEFVGVISLVK